MEYWMNFTFVMVILVTPILIAIKHDFKDIQFDLRVIMAPVTTAWALLILVFILEFKIVENYLQKIRNLKMNSYLKTSIPCCKEVEIHLIVHK